MNTLLASLLRSSSLAVALLAAAPSSFASEADLDAEPLIAAGAQHTCAVVAGVLQCWGNNASGQLGTGLLSNARAPMPVFGIRGDVASIATGTTHSCAVVDGAAYCWGLNASGQLGIPDDSVQLSPVAVDGMDSDVSAVAAGRYHTCAIKDGGVTCWGNNAYGQLGTGDAIAPPDNRHEVYAAGSGVTSIAAGEAHTCVVVGGSVECWGTSTVGQVGIPSSNDPSAPVMVAGINSAVSVTAGAVHTCALLMDRTARCWGNGGFGRLGTGTSNGSSYMPVPVLVHAGTLLTNITSLSAGLAHTCAASSSDGVFCWGYNISGQIGDASTMDRTFATSALGNSDVVVSAGANHTCTISSDSYLFCWGSDEFGQLGIASAAPDQTVPTAWPIDGLPSLAAGATHACGTDGSAYCWGQNRYGELGLGDGITEYSAVPMIVDGFPLLDDGASRVAAGTSHSCALTGSLGIWCWGINAKGQLGSGPAPESSGTPVTVTGSLTLDAVDIDAGSEHTCIALADGRVKCWGAGLAGQLGSGMQQDSDIPVFVTAPGNPLPIQLGGVSRVSAGSSHSCALAFGSSAYCWGSNVSGQLGTGMVGGVSPRATRVQGLDGATVIADISAGVSHTCAVVDGGVRCWGYGRLGDGESSTSPLPVAVVGIDAGATRVAAGKDHTCAIVSGGVRCWGRNDHGQLGNGSFTTSGLPVQAIAGGSGISEIVAGDAYTCASRVLGADKRTFCWGNGMYGRLGNGELGISDTPVLVAERLLVDGFDSL